ncbi:hypothetical protein J1N35_010817 [Gossypium stocksii]|uniref:Aminotransferase-like plant mobile domain-containing protein n=1 Tax=Gossypium stocksii TaxID=47602 RepID=A0A9D3W145_9ROSI|nr:hypothetical protein J1N35_010817 [Gossypium stocksii]
MLVAEAAPVLPLPEVASARDSTGAQCFQADLTPHAEGFCFFVWGTIYHNIWSPSLESHFGSKEGEEEKGKKEKKERREEEERKRRGGGGEGGRHLREEKRNREREEEGRKKKGKKKGIAMASLIDKELSHICDTVNNTDSFRKLRGRVNGVGYSPDARLMPYLEQAEFGSAALTRTFDLRYDLISALVERWRPKTHTFHLPCGECTVTLEDVALQFELPIDGDAVTSVSAIAEPAALCYSLLRASPGDAESTFSELKFT